MFSQASVFLSTGSGYTPVSSPRSLLQCLVPCPFWGRGVPPCLGGYSLSRSWLGGGGVGIPWLEGQGGGTPVRCQDRGRGTPYPPPPRQHTPWKGYAAGGTRLAITQEDFLGFNIVSMVMVTLVGRMGMGLV